MNLRDLIYSYNSNVESNTEDEAYHPNNNVVKSEDNNYEFDYDSDLNIYRKRQRLCKHMSSIPVFKKKVSNNKYKNIYENAPEIKYRSKLHLKDDQQELYTPGVFNFIKFEQNYKPLLTTQREIARNVFNITYHAKDYETANNALIILSQIDSIEVCELKIIGEMLRYSRNSSLLIKKLLKTSIRQKLVKSVENERKILLEMFLELLLSNGDLSTIRLFLQNRLTDSAYYNNYHLINLHVIIIIIEIIEFSKEVITFFNIEIKFPTIDEIINYPFQFYKISSLIYNLMICSSNHKLYNSKYKRESKQFIDELNKLYQYIYKPPKDKFIPIDVMELYISFFQATKNDFEINRIFQFQETYIRTIEENKTNININNNKSIVLSQYYNVILRCFTQLGLNINDDDNDSDDFVENKNSYLNGIFIKWLKNENKLSSKYVYTVVCLNNTCLNKYQLIKFIIASLESINSYDSFITSSSIFNIKIYLLWRKLASLLDSNSNNNSNSNDIDNNNDNNFVTNTIKAQYDENKVFWDRCFSLQTININNFDLIPLTILENSLLLSEQSIQSIDTSNLNSLNCQNDIEYCYQVDNDDITNIHTFSRDIMSLFDHSNNNNNNFVKSTSNVYTIIDNMDMLQLFDSELLKYYKLLCSNNILTHKLEKITLNTNTTNTNTKYYTSAKSNQHSYILSEHLMQLLTYKICICSHMYSDIYNNIFVLKSVQIIIFQYYFHSNKTCARNCLLYLINNNIDIKKATYCYMHSLSS